MTTRVATHITDNAVSNNDACTALYIDDLVDGIHPVTSAVERHVPSVAVYQLLILQYAVIVQNHSSHTKDIKCMTYTALQGIRRRRIDKGNSSPLSPTD